MSNIPLYWTAMICDEPTQEPVAGAQVTIKTNAGDLETYSGFSKSPSGWVDLQGEGHTGTGTTAVWVDVDAKEQGFGKTTVQVGTFDSNGFHWSINGLTNGIENTVWLRSKRGQSSSPLITDGTSSGFGALGAMSELGPITSVDGIIYAVDPVVRAGVHVNGGTIPASGGNLCWYRHVGRWDGSFRWEGPKKVGTGWGELTQVFSGGDGIIYGVTPMVKASLPIGIGEGMGGHPASGGDLMWFRHVGREDGSFKWEGPKKVGIGWGELTQLFSDQRISA